LIIYYSFKRRVEFDKKFILLGRFEGVYEAGLEEFGKREKHHATGGSKEH
jgi:hypothetical protein